MLLILTCFASWSHAGVFQTVTPIENPPSLSIDNDTDDKHCMTRCHANPHHKIQFIKIHEIFISSLILLKVGNVHLCGQGNTAAEDTHGQSIRSLT